MTSPEHPGPPVVTGEKAASAGSHLRSTLKHGSIYTIGLVLSRIISFVMIPIYTRVLTPADYGVLEVLSLTTDVISMLAGMGIGTAVTRYYFFYDDQKDRNAVVSSAAFVVLGVFSLIALIGAIVAAPLAELLLGPGASVNLVRLALLNLAIGASLEIPIVLLRAQQRSTTTVTVGLVRLLIGLGLNILLVVVLRLGVAGILISSITASAIVSGVLLWRMFREVGTRVSGAILRRMLAFGAPLVIWNLGSFVLHFSDRYFLRAYVSLEAVGIYSLSYKLAMLVAMFISGPFHDIWTPKLLQIDRSEGTRAPAILGEILAHYNLLLVTAALGLALFSRDVIELATGPDFHTAAKQVPLLALAMVFFGYRGTTMPGAVIRERSDLIARGTAIAGVAALALNMLLIPRWGVTGASLATLLSFVLEFLLMRALVIRIYPLPIPLTQTLLPVAIAASAWGVAELLAPSGTSHPLSVSIRVVAYIGFGGLLLLRGVLPSGQRHQLLSALRDPSGALRAVRQG